MYQNVDYWYSTESGKHITVVNSNISPSDFNNLKGVLQKYGHNLSVESNGVYDYAISYEKRK